MTGYRYRIIHPTDLSTAGEAAFAHALRLATLLKAEFHILHVHTPGEHEDPDAHPPAVRETLARWGIIAADTPRAAVAQAAGVHVVKIDIRDRSAAAGIGQYIARHQADLVVLATQGREGLDRILHGSVAEDIAATTDVPVLFVPSGCRGFVDAATGEASLDRVLVPVAGQPDPEPALLALARLTTAIALPDDRVAFVHVGAQPPVVYFGTSPHPQPVRLLEGEVIASILSAAADADLLVMLTEKRDSVIDVLRGTTTERIIRHAPCPVLAIPA
ncbi:universal stress protein [Ancylobacter terrae]|uniref:universal stress protein n=1 Tax=Ancylobacter sp. sgz301288 TaxID=3342077 RepID=UPI00385EE2E0